MCSYCKKHDETEVPDPYYGGAQGFEKVMSDDLIIRLSCHDMTSNPKAA